eukprot:1458331-Prymnesium_polylepis.1
MHVGAARATPEHACKWPGPIHGIGGAARSAAGHRSKARAEESRGGRSQPRVAGDSQPVLAEKHLRRRAA